MSFQLIILAFSTGRARSMDPFKTTQKAFKEGKLTFLPLNVNFPRLQ